MGKSNDDKVFELFEQACNKPFDGTTMLIIDMLNTNSKLMHKLDNLRKVKRWKRIALSEQRRRK